MQPRHWACVVAGICMCTSVQCMSYARLVDAVCLCMLQGNFNRMKPCLASRCISTATAGFVLLSLLGSVQSVTSAAVYTLMHRPGSLVTWSEEGLWLQVPQHYAARQARYVRTFDAKLLLDTDPRAVHSTSIGCSPLTNTVLAEHDFLSCLAFALPPSS